MRLFLGSFLTFIIVTATPSHGSQDQFQFTIAALGTNPIQVRFHKEAFNPHLDQQHFLQGAGVKGVLILQQFQPRQLNDLEMYYNGHRLPHKITFEQAQRMSNNGPIVIREALQPRERMAAASDPEDNPFGLSSEEMAAQRAAMAQYEALKRSQQGEASPDTQRRALFRQQQQEKRRQNEERERRITEEALRKLKEEREAKKAERSPLVPAAAASQALRLEDLSPNTRSLVLQWRALTAQRNAQDRENPRGYINRPALNREISRLEGELKAQGVNPE